MFPPRIRLTGLHLSLSFSVVGVVVGGGAFVGGVVGGGVGVVVVVGGGGVDVVDV